MDVLYYRQDQNAGFLAGNGIFETQIGCQKAFRGRNVNRTAIFLLLPLALLCSYSSFAQPVDSVEGQGSLPTQEQAEDRPAIEEPTEYETSESPMDGPTLLMGVFIPLHDDIKEIYGSAFMLSGQYCLNMSNYMDLIGSVSYVKRSGDPYYDVPTFSSDKSSTIKIIPLEASVRRRVPLMRSPSGFVSRGLYFGAGINYILDREKIPGVLSAKGGNFGAQIFAGPQIFFTENLAFEGEIKLLLNEVGMEYENEEYSINLSALVFRVALSWYY